MRNTKKAFTLIELSIILSIIIIISAGIIFLYNIVSENNKVSETIDTISYIRKNIEILGTIEPNKKESINIFKDQNQLPTSMKVGKELINSWKGKLLLSSRDNDYYNMTFYNIPESSCIKLISNSRVMYTKVEDTVGNIVNTNQIDKINSFCDNLGLNTGIVFSDFYEGEGAYNASVSTSTSYSVSTSTSNSISLSNSISASNSISTSNSISASNSISLSNSVSASNSISGSISSSKSISISKSVSNSVSTSNSVSLSNSISSSISASNSISNSLSNSISASNSISNSLSNSISASNSISNSVRASNSVSLSNSISNSISTSNANAANNKDKETLYNIKHGIYLLGNSQQQFNGIPMRLYVDNYGYMFVGEYWAVLNVLERILGAKTLTELNSIVNGSQYNGQSGVKRSVVPDATRPQFRVQSARIKPENYPQYKNSLN